MFDAEVEEAPDVQRGGAGAEGEAVAFDAAVADSAVPVGDDPGDCSLDEWSSLPVVGGVGAGTPFGEGSRENLVVTAEPEELAS